MITFLAPAEMCAAALVASVKCPVDSITMSAPRSRQGSAPGSRSEVTVIDFPFTTMELSVKVTSLPRRPRMESYLSRWASVLLSVRSLMPTISMSAPVAAIARK